MGKLSENERWPLMGILGKGQLRFQGKWTCIEIQCRYGVSEDDTVDAEGEHTRYWRVRVDGHSNR